MLHSAVRKRLHASMNATRSTRIAIARAIHSVNQITNSVVPKSLVALNESKEALAPLRLCIVSDRSRSSVIRVLKRKSRVRQKPFETRRACCSVQNADSAVDGDQQLACRHSRSN